MVVLDEHLRVFFFIFFVLTFFTGIDSQNNDVVIKQISKSISEGNWVDSIQDKFISQESKNHPSILRILDIETEFDITYLIFEYCEGGDFSSFISHHEKLEDHQIQIITHQFSNTLFRLNEKQSNSRNLSSSKIFFSSKSTDAIAKFADFSQIEIQNIMSNQRIECAQTLSFEE
jgi:serine/threonine protein kinase